MESEVLVNILEAYSNTLLNWGDYVDFDFSYRLHDINHFSAGQRALYSSMSRLYAQRADQTIGDNIDLRDVLLVIDEPDLYLHPKWQQEFMGLLLKFLSRAYPPKTQIVITSHSPIIISDILKYNVIFLDRNEDGIKVIDGLEDKKETFGANIHTLMTDTMFLKNGLIGDFAKDKLDKVISDLNSRNAITPERKLEIKKIIQQIGEPIIRRKLLELFHDYFNLDVDDRIAALEDEIKQLRNLT